MEPKTKQSSKQSDSAKAKTPSKSLPGVEVTSTVKGKTHTFRVEYN